MMSEEQIWNSFRQGDLSSFEYIYDQYADELYRYSRNFATDVFLIEDCIQELFTRIWEKKATLGSTTSIRFYLLRSMRRLLLRKLEQNRKRYQYETKEDGFIFEITHSPETTYITHEGHRNLQEVLLKAINSLPVNQREVMYLRYFQELSLDEISEITTISKKTAYNLVYLALNTLRKKLKNITWILCCWLNFFLIFSSN